MGDGRGSCGPAPSRLHRECSTFALRCRSAQGSHCLQKLADLIVVVTPRRRLELGEQLLERLADGADRAGSDPHYRLVAGPFGRLVVVRAGFVETLSRSQTRVDGS